MKKKYVVSGAVGGIVLIYFIFHSLFVQEKVKVSEVRRGNFVTVVYATGNVGADSTATLRSEAGGVVTYDGVHEGTTVRRGELLLKTDDSDDLLRVEQAAANLESAQIDLQDKLQNLSRIQALFKSGSATQKQLDDAQTIANLAKVSVQQNKIALGIAKEQLSKTRVTAPFSGVIISTSAKLGDYLLPNGVCFEMIAPKSILVDAEVDEQDLARIGKGQKCVVAFDAFGDRKFDGYVYRIVPKTNEATKTSRVFVKLLGPPANLNVGMTATVNIVSSELHDVLLVPRTAVLQLPDSNVVYEVQAGKLKEVRVDVGASDGRLSEILGNTLRPGAMIVSEPGPGIRNGMQVEAAD